MIMSILLKIFPDGQIELAAVIFWDWIALIPGKIEEVFIGWFGVERRRAEFSVAWAYRDVVLVPSGVPPPTTPHHYPKSSLNQACALNGLWGQIS